MERPLAELISGVWKQGNGIKTLHERATVVSKKCAVELCIRPAAAEMRGLCMLCYSKAKKKVESGEVTWDQLEDMGLCLPKVDVDPFTAAYNQAKEKR